MATIFNRPKGLVVMSDKPIKVLHEVNMTYFITFHFWITFFQKVIESSIRAILNCMDSAGQLYLMNHYII